MMASFYYQDQNSVRDHSLFMKRVGLARVREGHVQSRRLEEGVIMKYINKCGGPPNLLYTVNDSSNQNSAYIKKLC